MSATMGRNDGGFRSRLQIFECEGHGRYFEVYEDGEYAGTYDKSDGALVIPTAPYRHPSVTLGEVLGGRVAEVYGYNAYEAACAKVMEADPDGWDVSDVVPVPVLVVVRVPQEDWLK